MSPWMSAYLVAYIDPGTGGVILQLIIATIVGAGFYFRKALSKVMSAVFGHRSKDGQKPDGSDGSESGK